MKCYIWLEMACVIAFVAYTCDARETTMKTMGN